MIVLATEGLDMMAHVSGVLDSTIASAEGWCERLGRRRQEGAEGGDADGKDAGVMVGANEGSAERGDEKRALKEEGA